MEPLAAPTPLVLDAHWLPAQQGAPVLTAGGWGAAGLPQCRPVSPSLFQPSFWEPKEPGDGRPALCLPLPGPCQGCHPSTASWRGGGILPWPQAKPCGVPGPLPPGATTPSPAAMGHLLHALPHQSAVWTSAPNSSGHCPGSHLYSKLQVRSCQPYPRSPTAAQSSEPHGAGLPHLALPRWPPTYPARAHPRASAPALSLALHQGLCSSPRCSSGFPLYFGITSSIALHVCGSPPPSRVQKRMHENGILSQGPQRHRM